MSRLPGPRTPRAIASLTRSLVREPTRALVDMHATYGPVVEFGIGRLRYVYLLSPEANELVLSTSATCFTWREAFQPLVPIDGETALVVSDGDDHARRRRIVQPAFQRRRIDGYVDLMVEEAERVVSTWKPGRTVDGYDVFRPVIRRTVLRCLFGDELAARDAELAPHLETALAYVNRPPERRLDWDLPGLPYRAARRARAAIDAVVFGEIDRRRRSGDDRGDVLSWLIARHDDELDPLTDQEVRDQVVSLIAAGYDTTSSAMGWALAELARDPHHAERIRAEVGGDPVTAERVPSLVFTRAFVDEVLRRHPPAIWSPRHVREEVVVHGRRIPAGRNVLYSPFLTAHLPEQFPDPFRFDPHRFLRGHPDHHRAHPYAYVPFGGGSRRCLGFGFATQLLVVMLATVAPRTTLEFIGVRLPAAHGVASSAPDGGVPLRIG